jgi:hypothetical protein
MNMPSDLEDKFQLMDAILLRITFIAGPATKTNLQHHADFQVIFNSISIVNQIKYLGREKVMPMLKAWEKRLLAQKELLDNHGETDIS